MTQAEQSNQLQHNPFQVLQKEKPSFTETKKQQDIGEACVDVCYSEQKIESVKAENTPLVGKHPEDLAQSTGKSSVQDPKSAHSLTEIAKQQEMRKPRRRFVVLDDDSDFEGEGGASSGKFSSLSPDEHYVPLNNLYSEPEIEFVVLDDDNDFEGQGGASGGKFSSLSPDEHYVPVNNLYTEPQIESADYVPAQALIDPIWRDENSYDDLLEDVIDNDLAMKTTIDDLELLIFSSRELPHKHWRLRRKYYLWGVFRRKSSSCSSIPTANSLAQTSSIQNAAMSCLLNEVEGANTGSSQGQSFPSPLSILKGVNSGSPQGRFPSSLSSRCNSPESSLNNMERECGRNLDTRNQDVEQHDKYRIQASDIYFFNLGVAVTYDNDNIPVNLDSAVDENQSEEKGIDKANMQISVQGKYGKTSFQKYAQEASDEMQTEEKGINSSNSKGNSLQVMEQVTDSECTAYVAINFSDVADGGTLAGGDEIGAC
ncbi:hypothetical protein RND71_014783 [Anisodus tanguticus]|uniref:AIPP2-like SPOC-like domain-containing protein n=1 Tax=Anisodus tanguticus TaxID=243964 RepID=A0AAE1SCI6_9SOLA|nr:hypothetical protein RND71_014783 [Anisodus tanguticus]